jgi:hypothetical protein
LFRDGRWAKIEIFGEGGDLGEFWAPFADNSAALAAEIR